MNSSCFSAVLLFVLLVFAVQVQGVSQTDPKSTATTGKSPETQKAKSDKKSSTSAPIPPKSGGELLNGLKISIIVPGHLEDHPLRAYPIFSNGKLHPFFQACTNESEAASSAGNKFKHRTCFRHSAYTDRLALFFEYDEKALAKSNNITFEARNLVANGSVTKAAIQNTGLPNFTSEHHAQPLTLMYNCIRGKNGTATLSMVLTFRNATSQSNVKLAWQKACRSGRPEHVVLAYPKLLHRPMWPPSASDQKLVVSPSLPMSTFSAELQVGSNSSILQAFKAPVLTVGDSSVLHAILRGSGTGGILQTAVSSAIIVIYECQASGKSSVTLTMGIPPFSNVTVSWTKECGGRIATSLMIGTKPKTSDVVQNGIVQKQYMMSNAHIGTPHSEKHFHLESSRVLWKLYIWTKSFDEGTITVSQGLHMGHPVLSVGDTSVVYASTSQMFGVLNTGHRSTYDFKDSSVVIKNFEEVELSFYLVCKKVGESRIVVTIPLTHFDALEFGFAKKCDSRHIPRVHVRPAATTGSLGTFLIILGALACAGAIAFGCYRIRQRQIEYKRVPTGQR